MLGIGLNGQIAFSAANISRSIEHTGNKINKSVREGYNGITSAINSNTSAINGLNSTFDNEFNNPNKRTIQIIFQNEDGEDEKLSKLFNQVPLFKDEFLEGFNKYPEELSEEGKQAIYKEIDEDESLKRAFTCWADYSSGDDFKYINKYDFEKGYESQETPIALPEKYNDTIPYYLYRHITDHIRCIFDFWNYVDAFKKDLKNKIDSGITKERFAENQGDWGYWRRWVDKYHYSAEELALVRDWNPTEELKKKINDSIDYRQDRIDYYLKKFNSPLQNFVTDLLDKYKKESINVEIKTINSFKIVLIINNYYLIVKRAPNVNVGNGEF